MTGDALRTQLAEDIGCAFFVALHADNGHGWAEVAWDDMGGSERSQERAEYEIAALDVVDKVISSALARARAEGAAEALQDAAESVPAHWANPASQRPLHIGTVAGWLRVRAERITSASALSAHTTEGDLQ